MSGRQAEVDPRSALRVLAAAWGFDTAPGQAEGLFHFADLLIRWNQSINLTGAKSMAALVTEHYPDAFALAKRLEHPARLVDVGSGGGLPAVPLALLRPALTIHLCEPIAKKAAFLRTAVRELALADRVTLDTRRGEQLADELAQGAERFDAATSRATFAPDVWVALGRRLVHPGGRVFVLTVPGTAIEGATDLYGHGTRALIEVSLSAQP
jgi:16S rRNA (guanine527-N7)-methyltransferase